MTPLHTLLLLAAVSPQSEQEATLEGHSYHGEAFNEGPRQAAYLMDNPDSVHFPVTATGEDAQRFFDQGVGQLHGFWYFEAERSFRQVAAMDPDCAMAYWGMAMANPNNEERAQRFARVAWLKRGLASEREQMYIDAMARFHDVEGPEEPKVFEEKAKEKEKEEKEQAKTEAKADKASAKDGEAESEDDDEASEEDETNDGKAPEKDAKAKKGKDEEKVEGPPKKKTEKEIEKEAKERERERNARKRRATRLVADYEEIIWEYPDDIEAKAFLVNRMWMNRGSGLQITSRHANEALLQQIFAVQPEHPAHHYRIHLWDDPKQADHVVDSAVASGPSWPATAHMWHMGGHIFARLGRHTDAAWQQEASARVDHAFMIRDRVLPDQIHNFAHNNEWLTRSMRHHGRVTESVALAKNMIELPRHPEYNMVDKRGSAAYGRRRLLETLELFEQWEELVGLCDTMYLEPSEEATDRSLRAYLLGKAHAYLGNEEEFETQVAELEALIVEAKLERVEALETVEEEALAAEYKATEVLEVMEMVLDEHKDDLNTLRNRVEALRALRGALAGEDIEENLETLRKRSFEKSHLARIYLTAEDDEKAVELAREAIVDKDGQLYPHATLAYVLHETGETEEALEVFDELRGWTTQADLGLPVFERLAPLAELRDLPADWRAPAEIPEDVGNRPDIATLGPLRWSPPPAADWTAPDGFGEDIALADYSGRPVIVIFFLGFGCVHCVEQLGVFAPVYDQFLEAGIEIVTIGTNSAEELADSLSDEFGKNAGDYPFPILSDDSYDLFKLYRAYDDFEDIPLHGTFLIDEDGLVRWQDISYEPFMEWEFLLKESERLLGLPVWTEDAPAVSATPIGRSQGGGR